jgi:hypothetical protein
MPTEKDELVELLPPRKILFRERGATRWQHYHFTILGRQQLLGSARSSRPMHLQLATNIDGFRSTEVIGLDLFAAVASAMLTAESIIITLQRIGEVRLRSDTEFEIESDSVFFGSRAQVLREAFRRPD